MPDEFTLTRQHSHKSDDELRGLQLFWQGEYDAAQATLAHVVPRLKMVKKLLDDRKRRRLKTAEKEGTP